MKHKRKLQCHRCLKYKVRYIERRTACYGNYRLCQECVISFVLSSFRYDSMHNMFCEYTEDYKKLHEKLPYYLAKNEAIKGFPAERQ